jgi:hypothetical protein
MDDTENKIVYMGFWLRFFANARALQRYVFRGLK